MKRYALVVGITHYQSNSLPELEKASLDAEAVAQVLEKHGDFQEVTRLPRKWISRYQAEVTAGEVTKKKFIESVRSLLFDQAENSEALIYFSGHGIAPVNDTTFKPEGFLATSDSAIRMSDLNALIADAKVSSLMVLLDCCHAGSLLENDLVKQTLTAFKSSEKDYYLIAACRPKEKAYEGEQYSIFTEALLKGLKEKQAGNDGKISCDRLFAVIDEELKRKGQEPIRLGYGRSLILVSYPGRSPGSAVEPLLDKNGELCCPYQGLLAFTKAERSFFFGRDQVVEELERKLERQSFVPLIGASGSGKSSVVLAGLVPWLEELGWQVLDPLKPGFKPLAKLEEVLRKKYFSEKEQLLDKCIHDQSSEGLKPLLECFPQGRHLLVVDQFEELFTVAQAEQRDRFIQLITQVAEFGSIPFWLICFFRWTVESESYSLMRYAFSKMGCSPEFPNSPLAIVTTMRADFLEPCLYYDSLRQLIEEEAKYLPTLAGLDLIEAIVEPAKRQGYKVTDELLYQIFTDIKQEPGFLPLLEFALTQLWSKRDEENHQLTLKGYKAIGGMLGALNRHADNVYDYRDYEKDSPQDKRPEAEKGLIKRIFLKLLQIGEGEKDTRVRQPKAVILSLTGDNLEEKEILKKLIDGKQGLVQGRLLVTGGSEQEGESWVDLAHEALIEGWEKLNEWRTETREGRKLARQVEKDAQNWQASGKSPDYLWVGIKLDEAEKVMEEYATTVPLSKLAQEFVEACREEELRSYLRSPNVDSLDHKALEKEVAVKSFLTIPRLWRFLENESEEAKVRLGASWLLKQWGEEVPMWLAEIDEEEKISLRIVESPPSEVIDLGKGISLEMVKIPGGEFWMGASEGEESSYAKQFPQHKVRVSPFLMGKYPVTQAQWRAIASLSRVERDLDLDPSYFKGDNRPVEQVIWDDAREFCKRLARRDSRNDYRLPSEAEWEYACRAGTTTPYHFGKKMTPDLANYSQAGRGGTTPVGRFQVANAFGLYDMYGQVFEWCEDDWHDDYEGAPTDGSAWIRRASDIKVVRGGAWHFNPWYCRSACRDFNARVYLNGSFGFRVVCVAPRTK